MSVDPVQVLGALMVGTVGWLFRREIAGQLLDRIDGFFFPAERSTVREPVDYSSALRPVGGAPSWESVRKERDL